MPKRLQKEDSSATPTYARFVAEPFETGYGHTIGNSLRRVLLSSLEGAAITSVKIDGAMHEFTTIEGVVEDVTLRHIRLRDGDGYVHFVPNGEIKVLSNRTRGFAPTGPSRLVVIDPASDAVVGSIRLTGANAFGDASGIVREPGTGRLVVGTPGDIYRVGDGGLERVDPATLTAEGRFFVTEDALGGNITDFVLLSPVKGYAVVQANDLRNHLVAFDPSGVTTPRDVLVREGFLPDIVLGPDGLLWVADMSQPSPGLHRVDPRTDRMLPPRVIGVGLPPFSIGFTP